MYGIVNFAYCTIGRHFTQSEPRSFTDDRRHCSIVRLGLSACPFAFGWKAVVSDFRDPMRCKTVVQKAIVRRVSRSDDILMGVPNHLQWWATNCSAVCSASEPSNFRVTRFTHFVS